MNAPNTQIEDLLKVEVVGTNIPTWINSKTVDLVVMMITEALTQAKIMGSIKVSFMTTSNVRKRKNERPYTMYLGTGGKLRTMVEAVVIGENQKHICLVTMHMSGEYKPACLGYFAGLPNETFTYYPKPKVLEGPPSVKKKSGEVKLVRGINSLQQHTTLDKDTIILCLLELQQALQKTGEGFILKSTAVILLRDMLGASTESEDNLTETLITSGYLNEDTSGKVTLVEISPKGLTLITKSTAVIETVKETPQVTVSVSPQAVRFDKLRGEIKTAEARLAEAQEKNVAVQNAISPLLQKITQSNEEIASQNKKADALEAQAQTCRARSKSLRTQVLQMEQVIATHKGEMVSGVGALELTLKQLRVEMQELVNG